MLFYTHTDTDTQTHTHILSHYPSSSQAASSNSLWLELKLSEPSSSHLSLPFKTVVLKPVTKEAISQT